MEKIKVKPVEGRVVIHPISLKPLKKEGEVVYRCSQIKRYLKFGDVTIVKDKIIKKKKTTNNTGE